jgi:branched-chain amino acid transport system substrate-binding protein
MLDDISRREFMKKTIGAGAVIASLSFLGCAEKKEEPTPTPEEKPPIKIGGTISLTGKYADSGIYYKRAYELWGKRTNKAGGLLGREVEIIILDDESDPNIAISRYENLITRENVDLLIGPYSSTIVYPVVKQIAEKYKMVLVEGGGTSAKIFNEGFKYVFLTLPGLSEQHAIGFFQWLSEQPKETWPTKTAIIYGDRLASISNAAGMREKANEFGIEIVVDEKYPADITDLSPIISKAKDAGADLLMAGTYFPDAILIVRTMKELNYNPKAALLTAGVSDERFGITLGKDAEGILGTAWWHPSAKNPGSREFDQRGNTENN